MRKLEELKKVLCEAEGSSFYDYLIEVSHSFIKESINLVIKNKGVWKGEVTAERGIVQWVGTNQSDMGFEIAIGAVPGDRDVLVMIKGNHAYKGDIDYSKEFMQGELTLKVMAGIISEIIL